MCKKEKKAVFIEALASPLLLVTPHVSSRNFTVSRSSSRIDASDKKKTIRANPATSFCQSSQLP
jgi:hypothetical protein